MSVSQYLKKSFFYALDFAYDIKDALIPSSQKVQIQRTTDHFLQTQTYPEGWSPERQFTAAERDYVYLKRSYFVKEKASPMEAALFNALNDIRKDGQNPEKTLCDALCHLTAAQWKFSRKKALFLKPENNFLILNYFKRIALEKGAAQDSPAIQYVDRTMQSCPIKVFTRLFSENEVDSYYKKMNQSNSIKKAVGIPFLCMALFFGLYSIYNKGIADFFMRNTIFHAMDSQRISEEIQRNTSLNWMEQIGRGIYSEFEDFLPSILKYALLHSIGKYAAKKMGLTEEPEKNDLRQNPLHDSLSRFVIRIPIIEEIVFRGLFQNGLGAVQSALSSILPFSCSPAFPILGSNLYFSLVHLQNSDPDNGYLNRISTISKVLLLLLHPQSSILHTTSGGLTASISAHITRNLICTLV